MEKWIKREHIYRIMESVDNLEREEFLSRTVNENVLERIELLEREVRELSFHISRFACEGETLAEINKYTTIMEYVDLLMEKRKYSECAITVTALKIFFDLDVNFFTLLPKLSEEIEKNGPISFDDMVEVAEKALKPNKKRR